MKVDRSVSQAAVFEVDSGVKSIVGGVDQLGTRNFEFHR